MLGVVRWPRHAGGLVAGARTPPLRPRPRRRRSWRAALSGHGFRPSPPRSRYGGGVTRVPRSRGSLPPPSGARSPLTWTGSASDVSERAIIARTAPTPSSAPGAVMKAMVRGTVSAHEARLPRWSSAASPSPRSRAGLPAAEPGRAPLLLRPRRLELVLALRSTLGPVSLLRARFHRLQG